MSKSSATFRIISISNGKTYYTIMQCDQGDINQFYDDGGAVFPTFGGTNCPTLMFLVYDSENSAKSIVVPDANIKWFVNGVELTFSGQISTNKFNGNETGHFKRIVKTINGVNIQCLQVIKNLTGINSNSSFAITATATGLVENTSTDLSASFPVTIAYGDTSSKKVRIQSPSGYTGTPFTIDQKGGQCKIQAVVVTNSDEGFTVDGFTFEWYQQVNGTWTKLSSTSHTLTVLEEQVDGSALFMCKVYNEKDKSLYGTDICSINDISDPWQVYPNPVVSETSDKPATLICVKGSGVAAVFKPYVKHAGSEDKLDASKCSFSMGLFNSAGTKLNAQNSAYNPPFLDSDKKTVFVIPEAFISENGGIDGEIVCEITETQQS